MFPADKEIFYPAVCDELIAINLNYIILLNYVCWQYTK